MKTNLPKSAQIPRPPRPPCMDQPSPRARPPREKRTCNVCKKEFQPKSGNHFFCSKSCQRAHSLVKLTDLDVGISALADDLARDPEAKALMMELSGVKGIRFREVGR